MTVHAAVLGRMPSVKGPWAWHLGALAAVLVLIVALFWDEVSNAVSVWWIYPTYSHCFLIIPISLWLIWDRRETLEGATPAIEPRALWAIPLLLAVWMMARIATINEIRQLAVVGLAQVALLTLLGWRVYRLILFPALYLFFLVPVGQYLIPPMQTFATWFTDGGLTMLGIVHFTEGTVIQLTNGSYQIAEACAGLRFLIATVTLGVLFAHLTYHKWWKIGAFLVACVVVSLVANGLRCIGIILLAHFTDNRLAVGADHLVYGWGFNVFIMLVMFFLGLRFRDPPLAPRPPARFAANPVPRFAVIALAAGTILAIAVGPAAAYWRENRRIVVNDAAFARPVVFEGWTAGPANTLWHLAYRDLDRQIAFSLKQSSSTAPAVDAAIGYYGRMRAGHSLLATTNGLWDGQTWHEVESHGVTTRIGSDAVRFNETIIATVSENRLVWSSYWMDGRFTTSSIMIKLLQLKTAITGNEGSALIAFSTPIDGTVDAARTRLAASLAAFNDLSERLVEAGQSAGGPQTAN